MKDKTKKGLIIAGLAAVCVIAVFGISRVLYKEPVQTLPEESKATEELELMIDTDETVQVPEETESTEKKTDLVIEVETDKAGHRKSSRTRKRQRMKNHRNRRYWQRMRM